MTNNLRNLTHCLDAWCAEARRGGSASIVCVTCRTLTARFQGTGFFGPSAFLVGSTGKRRLRREVQPPQPEEDHRLEVPDVPEAPRRPLDRLDHRVEPLEDRVRGLGAPPVEDALALLPEGARHDLHLRDVRVC